MMINYIQTEGFKKDLKKLLKRFRSLEEDIEIVKKAVIELRHIHEIDNLSSFQISGFGNDNFSFWKIKKIACKAIKGKGVKSGLRIVYVFDQKTSSVIFLEIYYKGDKENEDKDRIRDFFI